MYVLRGRHPSPGPHAPPRPLPSARAPAPRALQSRRAQSRKAAQSRRAQPPRALVHQSHRALRTAHGIRRSKVAATHRPTSPLAPACLRIRRRHQRYRRRTRRAVRPDKSLIPFGHIPGTLGTFSGVWIFFWKFAKFSAFHSFIPAIFGLLTHRISANYTSRLKAAEVRNRNYET
jgi:hypothetical protein